VCPYALAYLKNHRAELQNCVHVACGCSSVFDSVAIAIGLRFLDDVFSHNGFYVVALNMYS